MANRYRCSDPERHRAFLRALCGMPGSFRFVATPARSARRIGLDTFLKHLEPDASTLIDFDDAETIRIDTLHSRDPEDPAILWRLQYDVPWSEVSYARIDALRRACYG